MSSIGYCLTKLADKHLGLSFNPDCDAQPASAGVSSVDVLALFKEVKDALNLSRQSEECLKFKTQVLHFDHFDTNASSSHTHGQGNVLRCPLTASRQSRPPLSPVRYGARCHRCLIPFRWRWPGMPAHSP